MVTTYKLDAAGSPQRIAEHDTMRDASAHLPQGAYTTFRTYDGNRVLRLGQHLQRLRETLGLEGKHAPTIDDDAVRAGIAYTIRDTRYAESRFRLTYAPAGFFISIEPFTPYPPALYETGVACATVSLHRENPHAKSTTFIASAADAYSALPAGVHEGLMIAADGAVLEGLSSNFFAIQPLPDPPLKGREPAPPPLGGGWEGVLRTEEARALIGVTRSLVLEVARDVIPITTEAVRYADLPRVSECFITSVSREIMPVVKIDQLVIGDGSPGPITRALMGRFRALVTREAIAVS
jgi:branched-chain amino acid aminotransferase